MSLYGYVLNTTRNKWYKILAWNVFTYATSTSLVHLLVFGKTKFRILIDSQHMLYTQCGIVLVGGNVNFAITGRGQLHHLHNVQRHEMPKIHLQIGSSVGLKHLILLPSRIVGCPTKAVICYTLKNKRQCLTKSTQFEPYIPQRKKSLHLSNLCHFSQPKSLVLQVWRYWKDEWYP